MNTTIAKTPKLERAIDWIAARLDAFAARSAEEFERKMDAITRLIVTTMVTGTLCIVLVACVVHYLTKA